jgi:hypothetical protein
MAEILGIGCSQPPMILNPGEEWGHMCAHIYARGANYQALPELLDDVGEDNGRSADRRNQARMANAFRGLHDRLHAWAPDVLKTVQAARDIVTALSLYRRPVSEF